MLRIEPRCAGSKGLKSAPNAPLALWIECGGEA
jgi:hypothetical protein